jgi:GTP cyclohydrolase II
MGDDSLMHQECESGLVKNVAQSLMWVDDIEAECKIQVWSTSDPKVEIVTIVKGVLKNAEGVPARVHSECFTGDIIGSQRCDCGQQLHNFLRILNVEARGVLMYVRGHEGRGIGLANKIKAYKLQDEGFDTVDANLQLGLPVDSRTYEDALAVFQALGLKTLRLYTNNPEKSQALAPITHCVVPLPSIANEHNLKYLTTKRERTAHRTILDRFGFATVTEDVSKARIAVVHASSDDYVGELLTEVVARLESAGRGTAKVEVHETTALICGVRDIIDSPKLDAIVVLGVDCASPGDVSFDAVRVGLTQLAASQDVPIILGLAGRNWDCVSARTFADSALRMAAISLDASLRRC